MTKPSPLPTDWHFRPRGSAGPCPTCGFRKRTGEHRAVPKDENLTARWIVRRKTTRGWVYESIEKDAPPKKDRRKPRNAVRQSGPTPRVAKLLGQAARLAAAGKSLTEVAETLRVKSHHVLDWKCRWPEFWAAARDKARESFVTVVRNIAGTDAILKDPGGFLAMAEQANRWCEEHQEELFPHDGEVTLSKFYFDYYVPNCMAPGSSRGYRKFFEVVVRRWRLITGDPPLEKIDNALLARFRDYVGLCRGHGGKTVTAVTVANYLGMIQRLLDKAGPVGPRNRSAAGLIPQVPYVKRPTVSPAMVKIAGSEELSLVYKAAGRMIVPEVAGVATGDWWRCLLVVAFNTGLRRRTLFELRWEHLDANRRMLLIPPECLKSKRPLYAPLNQLCLDHLERIKTDRERIFDWPYHGRYFDRVFHRLQYDAGLPMASHFGLQEIRKTTATRLWQTAPQAAKLALGHATDNVTIRHYVQAETIVAKAIDALPQPEAFTSGNGKEGAA